MEGRGAGGADDPAPSPAPDAEAPVRRRRHRPLYRRLFHYVRTAWTGVKFALGMVFKLTSNYIISLIIICLRLYTIYVKIYYELT